MKRYGNGIIIGKGGGSGGDWPSPDARYFFANKAVLSSMDNAGKDGDIMFVSVQSGSYSTPNGVNRIVLVAEQNFTIYMQNYTELDGGSFMLTPTEDLSPRGDTVFTDIGRGFMMAMSFAYLALATKPGGKYNKTFIVDSVYKKVNGIWTKI